jgi:hypothetical protein
MSDDDSIEINLRPPDEVGRRLVILANVLARVGLESNAPIGGDPDDLDAAEEERLDQIAWLKDEGIWGAVSPREADVLSAQVGAMSFEALAESSWQAERFAALAWAAHLLPELSDFPTQAQIGDALNRTPTAWNSAAEFIASIELRSDEETAAELERSDVWLWRAEIEETRRVARRDDLVEIAATIAEVVEEGVAAGLMERAPDGDFLVAGKPFHRLTEDERSVIAAIAAERLRALNWLRGAGDDWDNLSAEL